MYSVTELKITWKLTRTVDKATIDFNVPKDICPTFADLERYVAKSNIF